MTDNAASLLATKISETTTNADAFPELSSLGVKLGKQVAVAIGEMLSLDVSVSTSAPKMLQLNDVLSGEEGIGSYSWLIDGMDTKGAFIILDNGLVSIMTEMMLGGPLSAHNPEAQLSRIDVSLSYSCVESLMGVINRTVQKFTGPTDDLVLVTRESLATPEEAAGEIESLAMFEFTMDMRLEGNEIPSALRVCFPVDYVDRAGFLAPRPVRVTDIGDSSWSQKLVQNVKELPIGVRCILGRQFHPIGELSRLQIGDFIELEADSVEKIDLIVDTVEGPANIAVGRLGVLKKNKAVKLSTDIADGFAPQF